MIVCIASVGKAWPQSYSLTLFANHFLIAENYSLSLCAYPFSIPYVQPTFWCQIARAFQILFAMHMQGTWLTSFRDIHTACLLATRVRFELAGLRVRPVWGLRARIQVELGVTVKMRISWGKGYVQGHSQSRKDETNTHNLIYICVVIILTCEGLGCQGQVFGVQPCDNIAVGARVRIGVNAMVKVSLE